MLRSSPGVLSLGRAEIVKGRQTSRLQGQGSCGPRLARTLSVSAHHTDKHGSEKENQQENRYSWQVSVVAAAACVLSFQAASPAMALIPGLDFSGFAKAALAKKRGTPIPAPEIDEEEGKTILVETVGPEAITSPQGLSSYVEGVDALEEVVQVVKTYEGADGKEIIAIEEEIIPENLFLAEKPTPTEEGQTILVENVGPEAIITRQGISTYEVGVDALDEVVQVLKTYQSADGKEFVAIEEEFIPADVFLAEKPTPTEGGETVLVELTSPEAITSPQGVSSYVEGVDALDEDVQVVRRYQAADGTEIQAVEEEIVPAQIFLDDSSD